MQKILTIKCQNFQAVCAQYVGNEELDTVNTKQIRVSAPGGSIALRYPAIGDGEAIAHLRVSGIDFGTDLKANIIDGGPGYKYVVLVFMGNEGVPYDAVVTIQTVQDNITVVQTAGYSSAANVINDSTYMNNRYDFKSNIVDSNKGIDDENNSAEDLSDSEISTSNVKSNAELTQSSSNVYYVQESSVDDTEDINNDSDEEDKYKENSNQEYSNIIQNIDKPDGNIVDFNEKLDYDDDKSEDIIRQVNNYGIIEPRAEKYSYNDDSEDETNEEPVRFIDQNLYEKYQALKPHFYDNFNVYPQEAMNQNTGPIDSHDSIDFNNPSKLEQTFNDEEIHVDKYRDDSDEQSIDYKK
ncbi:hypothetical protein K1T71_011420 [Dendrolimus kikuchii]|uniref:Uncharacterized protein n=1 Tax=Dendrolimus kikuchii TaxID=765133 RepID=A0ACC1CPB0_9NEOP|nr:hypothetical protein K1T71_011420 [Dendrolimus kikuchii]